MTETALTIVPAILQLFAALLFLASGVGVWRFPEFATRVHSPTKAASLGIALFAIALSLHHRDAQWIIEMILLVLFIFVTVPLGTQVLLRSAKSKEEIERRPKTRLRAGARLDPESNG